jgi:Relaxase/Mobilisation nuclease domain
MIVKISPSGTSFKGFSTYLTHDPKANTQDRVAWTRTHNLANDHVPSAVDEMVWTARNAELLKHEAGIRAGGRATESPVKDVSLNWSPEDKPTPEHMIQKSEEFMRHMGWHEHQVIMVAHNDKPHAHVHLMINAVHPETGRHLDDSFERRRAQEWALQYEREHERIYCEQRLKNPEDREKNMPRNMWMAFKANEQEFSRAEEILADNSPEIPENPKNAEWKILKEFQRDERTEFVSRGKSEFSDLRNSIYREVKDEFRERWAEYYEKRRQEADPEFLTWLKSEIVAERNAAFEPRRDAAFAELRQSRDLEYRGLLNNQKEARADLRWHQETGLDTSDFFTSLRADREARPDITEAYREAALETASRQPEPSHVSGRDPGLDLIASAGDGAEAQVKSVGAGIASFADSLFFDLTTLGSAKPVPMSAEERADMFREAAENTLKQQQYREREEEDAAGRERHKAFGE